MLILKGNFVFSKLLAGLGAVLMLIALNWMAAQQALAAPERQIAAPDAVAAEFYLWYLATMNADQDPLSDRHATFKNYVAKALTAQLVEQLRAGRTPEKDYFLQSAEREAAWRHQIAANTVGRRGNSADVIVVLGEEEGPRRVLALTMVLEAGAWKIRQVAAVEARSSKSSAEQLGI